MIWKILFRILLNGAQRLIFTMNSLPRGGPNFTILTQLAKLHFWPQRDQWDPIGTQCDQILIKFDPNGMKLGPTWAQYILIHKLPINRPSGRYVNDIN